MTKIQTQVMIGLVREIVRETAWACIKGRREDGLMTEAQSSSLYAYEKACNALHYLDPDADNFIASTYQP